MKKLVLASLLTFVAFNFSHPLYAQRSTPSLISWNVPTVTPALFSDEASFQRLFSGKQKEASRKEFTESDFKAQPDVENFRTKFLNAKTADELETLLNQAKQDWAQYSPAMKYFTANLIAVLPLRGIIWRMRPLFETGGFFAGNRATHGMAVQMVRQVATGIQTYFPTEQWTAGFAFVAEPSTRMTLAQQFKTVKEYQKFLSEEFVPALNESVQRLNSVLQTNPKAVFVWDHKIDFGTGTFVDDAQRYVGYGSAEVFLSTSLLYRAMHDALVFSAYNQDEILSVVGRIGRQYGIEAMTNPNDLGLTDQKRNQIVNEAVTKKRFLELQDYDSKAIGTNSMRNALVALRGSVIYQKRAYDLLRGADPAPAFALNPLKYRSVTAPKLKRAVDNMVAVVSGEAEVRDPVSGDAVRLNIPRFYTEPYKNLRVLMANDFDTKKEPAKKDKKNAYNETLSYRNYLFGRSIGWDNSSNGWAKIVPSAMNQKADYIATAKRVIHFSLGTPLVAGPVDIFAR